MEFKQMLTHDMKCKLFIPSGPKYRIREAQLKCVEEKVEKQVI